jgi:dUTP pyrophosphatase
VKKKEPGDSPVIRVRILDGRLPDPFPLPSFSTPGSAGMDLRAMPDGPLRLAPGERVRIPSGIAIHIGDPSVAGLVFPRSGLGSRGLVLSNLTGVIDADYTGPLTLALWNAGEEPLDIRPGDRVAQIVFVSVVRPVWEVVDEHHFTERGEGGFGHTGS